MYVYRLSFCGSSQALLPIGTPSSIFLPHIGKMRSTVIDFLKGCRKRQNIASLRNLRAKSVTGTSVFNRRGDSGFFDSFLTYWIVFVSPLVIFTITYGWNWNYHITTVQQQAMAVVTHHTCDAGSSSSSVFLPFHFFRTFILQNMSPNIAPRSGARGAIMWYPVGWRTNML